MKLLQTIGLSALALSISSFSQAHEITQGTVEVSGGSSLGLTNTSTEFKSSGSSTIDSTSYNVNFGGSYYVRDNLAIGINQSFAIDNTEYDDGSEETLTTSILAPNISFNLPVNDDASIKFSAGIIFAGQTYEDDIDEADASGTGYTISAGLNYFIRENISLNFTAEIVNYSVEFDDVDVEIQTKGLGLSASASYYFF